MALFRALVMALAVAALAPAHSAQAQDFPTQRVTIVVPFGAGSVTDILAASGETFEMIEEQRAAKPAAA